MERRINDIAKQIHNIRHIYTQKKNENMTQKKNAFKKDQNVNIKK